MAVGQNIAAWLPGVEKQIEIAPARCPDPGPGELLVEVRKEDHQMVAVLIGGHSLPAFIILYIVIV